MTASLFSALGALFQDDSKGLSVVVAILIGIIGVCVIIAGTLAVWQFSEKEATLYEKENLGRTWTRHERLPSPFKPSSPASSLQYKERKAKKGSVEESTVGGGTGGSALVLRKRGFGVSACAAGSARSEGSTGAPNAGSSFDALDSAQDSVYDTQGTMDSAMIQEILGSVDANTVRETQILLSSFNWDMDELLQQELQSQGRS